MDADDQGVTYLWLFFRNDQDDVKQGDDVRCLYTSAPVPFATQRERETEREREGKRDKPIAFLSFLFIERARRKREKERSTHTDRQTYRQKENISSPCSRWNQISLLFSHVATYSLEIFQHLLSSDFVRASRIWSSVNKVRLALTTRMPFSPFTIPSLRVLKQPDGQAGSSDFDFVFSC